jgi:hypothetical protein
MKISRIALLSALITVPMFSMENDAADQANTVVTNDVKNNTQETTEAKATLMTIITAFATARKDNSLAFLDFFANWTCNPIFNKLASFECLKGGRFENSITPAGRIIVSATFVAAFYAAYKAYNEQNNVDTDEDIFGDDENYDTN